MFRKNIEQLITKSDFDWYLEMINNDISAKKLSDNRKKELIEKSIEASFLMQKDVIIKYGEIEPIQYVIRMEIPLQYTREEPEHNQSYMGLFNVKNNSIKINFNTINRVQKIIFDNKCDDVLSRESIKDVAMMHEVFHYLETINLDLYTNEKIYEYRMFGIKFRKKLLVSSEIAAIHFSKIMNKLEYSPRIYEKIFILNKKN